METVKLPHPHEIVSPHLQGLFKRIESEHPAATAAKLSEEEVRAYGNKVLKELKDVTIPAVETLAAYLYAHRRKEARDLGEGIHRLVDIHWKQLEPLLTLSDEEFRKEHMATLFHAWFDLVKAYRQGFEEYTKNEG